MSLTLVETPKPVVMTDAYVQQDPEGRPYLVGRTEGHPSIYVTPGKYVLTSEVVRVERPHVVTRSGTYYYLAPSEAYDAEQTLDTLEGILRFMTVLRNVYGESY